MAIQFQLDFTTPFGFGDLVFARHPPSEIPNMGGPAWPPYRTGTIAQVKLVLKEELEKALVVTHPTEQKTLSVACVIYTILSPPTDPHQSAITVECSMAPDSAPMIFGSEQEIKAYLAHGA
ncbi:hypothetical protein [Spirosoma gilvum]